jgi:hypothetical protein
MQTLKPVHLVNRNVFAGLKARSPGLKSGAGTRPLRGTKEAEEKFGTEHGQAGAKAPNFSTDRQYVRLFSPGRLGWVEAPDFSPGERAFKPAETLGI